MLDFGVSVAPGRGNDVMMGTFSPHSVGVSLAAMRIAVANITWPSANVAIFVPFVTVEPVVITKLWWMNNAVAVTNIDLGIYDEAGTRLVSTGSTAWSTAQSAQSVDIADTRLDRGRYYWAMATDGTAASAFSGVAPAAGLCQALGIVRQTSAFPLPSTATFVATTHAVVPSCGGQGYRAVGP